MARNIVWRLRDYEKDTITYFGKYAHVRKYFLENSHDHSIVVEEIGWTYKSELVNLLNESVNMGLTLDLNET